MKSFVPFFIFIFITTITTNTTAQDVVWETQISGTSEDLFDLSFVSDEIGYVVGNASTILKTTNAGDDWINIPLDFNIDIRAVQFINEQTGYIGGTEFNTVYKTIDGGQSWEQVTHSLPTDIWEKINDIYFINEDIGFIASSNGMCSTFDGGATWENLDESISLVNKIDFYDQFIGYASCSSGILKTIDGGQTWNLHKEVGATDFSQGAIIRSIQAMTSDIVYFGASYYGSFFSSFDGADTWNHEIRQTFDLSFVTPQIGFAINTTNFNSTIVKTTDNGATWEPQFQSTNDEGLNLKKLWMVSETAGWCIGDDGIIHHLRLAQSNSINELDQAIFTVFPNPTADVLYIDNKEMQIDKMRILDNYGRILVTYSNRQKYIDVSHLAAGKYYLQVETEGTISASAFIKSY